LLEIKPMTLVRQIDRMEQDGWIERRPDPADRRARRLVLTAKARPILARIRELSTEVRNEAFVGLSELDGQTLIDLLQRVHGGMSDRLGAATPHSEPPRRPVAAQVPRRDVLEAVIGGEG
jgi:DNA-binding MarR family transcriptional regulator